MTTTDRLKTLLDARHEAGLGKYGTTVDRTDITPDQWAQHALEEMLDGAAYLMRLTDEMAKREAHIQALALLVVRMEEAGDRMARTLANGGHDSVGQRMWTKAKGSKP